MEKMNVKLNGAWTNRIWVGDLQYRERRKEDRVGERMILTGLAKKGNLDIGHVFEDSM